MGCLLTGWFEQLLLCQRKYDQISELEGVCKSHFTNVQGHKVSSPTVHLKSTNCHIKDHPTVFLLNLLQYFFSVVQLSPQWNDHFLRDWMPPFLNIYFALHLAGRKTDSMYSMDTVFFSSLIKKIWSPSSCGSQQGYWIRNTTEYKATSKDCQVLLGEVNGNWKSAREWDLLFQKIRESKNFETRKDIKDP